MTMRYEQSEHQVFVTVCISKLLDPTDAQRWLLWGRLNPFSPDGSELTTCLASDTGALKSIKSTVQVHTNRPFLSPLISTHPEHIQFCLSQQERKMGPIKCILRSIFYPICEKAMW